MDNLLDLLGIVFLFILGGGAFYLFKGKDKGATTSINLSTPPTTKELEKIREEKVNELRAEDPNTFIRDHLDNAGDIDDIKRTSDGEFDDILNKHRNNVDG